MSYGITQFICNLAEATFSPLFIPTLQELLKVSVICADICLTLFLPPANRIIPHDLLEFSPFYVFSESGIGCVPGEIANSQ